MNDGNGAARRKAVLAGASGHFAEWYEYGLYGSLASTIAILFFPKSDPTTALLSTYAIFAAGFVVRPLGAVVFGHLGDRFGRRRTLLWAVTLQTAATTAMGLIPGYAQIGIAATTLLLLCRLVQSFAVGGDFSASYTLIVEHSPHARRGRYASTNMVASSLALMFGVLLSLVMTSTTTPEQLASWGWRLPFLAAAPLGLISLYLRLRVDESPVFAALRTDGHIESAPVKQAFKIAKKPMLIQFAWNIPLGVAYYFVFTFIPSYLATGAKLSKTESLLLLMVALAVSAVANVLAGFAVDVFGLKRVALASVLGLGAWAIPTFVFLQHSSMLGALLVVVVFVVLLSGLASTNGLLPVELFPAQVRASASGMAYQGSAVLFAGTAPFLATWLVARGDLLGPGYYLAGACAVAALVAAYGIGNRAQRTSRYDVMETPNVSTQQPSA